MSDSRNPAMPEPMPEHASTAATDDRIVRWFGRDRIAGWLERIDRFWSGEGRYLVSITTGSHGYRQKRDPSDVPERIEANLRAQAQVPGINPPSVFADFGTISLPRYWGGTVHWPEQTCPYIDPAAQDLDAALQLPRRAADDPRMDAARAVALYREASQRLGTDLLWLRSIDTQGPLNTAAMVLEQQELMMAMIERPDAVHALLDRARELLVEVVTFLRRATGGRVCGNIWPYTFLPIARGLSFTEDFMPLLSAELYRKFALPQLRQLSRTFGSLLIHCCGEWGRHAATLADPEVNVTGVEFHYPFTRIEQLAPLAERGAVFIPYIALEKQQQFDSAAAYYHHLLDRHGDRCRFWFAWPDDTTEARGFIDRVGEAG